MKRLSLILAFLLYSSGASGMNCRAQCLSAINKENTVLVHIAFEFRDPQFRTDWVYGSLGGQIKLPIRNTPYSPTNSGVHDGRLELDFCIHERDLPPLNAKFKAHLGPREFTISVRPIEWESQEMVNYWGTKVKQGRMGAVFFLNQPDPDWVVAKSAGLLESADQFPRIEIELYNFSNQAIPGVQLVFRSSELWACKGDGSPPESGTIPISIYWEKQRLKLASGDPKFAELINRRIDFKIDECGLTYLNADLGTTGALPPHDSVRLRYGFKEKLVSGRKSSAKRFKRNPVSLFYLVNRKIEFKGDHVFPNEIVVGGKPLGR